MRIIPSTGQSSPYRPSYLTLPLRSPVRDVDTQQTNRNLFTVNADPRGLADRHGVVEEVRLRPSEPFGRRIRRDTDLLSDLRERHVTWDLVIFHL